MGGKGKKEVVVVIMEGGARRGLQTDPKGLTVDLKRSHQIHD